MRLSVAGHVHAQSVVRDDVAAVVRRPGMAMREWALRNLAPAVRPAGRVTPADDGNGT